MILYANGDSHTYGIDVEPAENFVNLISEQLGYSCVNQAKIGASNARILRTTREFLKKQTPDLVLIGLSSWEREEWVYQDQYYDVNSSGHDVMPEQLQSRYRSWVLDQSTETLHEKSRYWNDAFYQLHVELCELGIRHLFFNSLYNFFGIKNYHDWGDSYLGPYDNNLSYYWYLKNQGCCADRWYHYDQRGHAVWAQRLLKELT